MDANQIYMKFEMFYEDMFNKCSNNIEDIDEFIHKAVTDFVARMTEAQKNTLINDFEFGCYSEEDVYAARNCKTSKDKTAAAYERIKSNILNFMMNLWNDKHMEDD